MQQGDTSTWAPSDTRSEIKRAANGGEVDTTRPPGSSRHLTIADLRAHAPRRWTAFRSDPPGTRARALLRLSHRAATRHRLPGPGPHLGSAQAGASHNAAPAARSRCPCGAPATGRRRCRRRTETDPLATGRIPMIIATLWWSERLPGWSTEGRRCAAVGEAGGVHTTDRRGMVDRRGGPPSRNPLPDGPAMATGPDGADAVRRGPSR